MFHRVRIFEVKFTEGIAIFELLASVGIPWDIVHLAFHRTRVLIQQIEMADDTDELVEWFTVWDYTTQAHTSWIASRSSEDPIETLLGVSGLVSNGQVFK